MTDIQRLKQLAANKKKKLDSEQIASLVQQELGKVLSGLQLKVPTKEDILKDIGSITEVKENTTVIREEVQDSKIRAVVAELLSTIELPKPVIVQQESEVDLSDYITSKDFNEALRKIANKIQRGGGGVREIPLDRFQFVYSVSNLPSPSRDGVIYLEDFKVYFMCGDVDLYGKRIVNGNSSCIMGASSENASLTSTGLDPNEYLITTDWTFPLNHITIKNVAKGVGVNLLGASTDTNLALDWTGVNFEGCTINVRCGDIDNFIFDKGAILGSGSIQFFGSAGTISLANSLFTASGDAYNIIQIEATANITRRFRTIFSSFVVFGSTVGIDFSTSATVPNEAYILITCNFSGGGTKLSGVTSSDNKALFYTNVGITNSADVSQYYMNGNATATTISATGTPVKVAGTTTSSSVTTKFTNTDNRATYVGVLNRYFKVTATASVSSGNGHQIGLYIAKNGVVIDDSEIYGTTNAGGRAENINIQSLVLLTTNDYIEIFTENNTAITDVTVTDLNVIIQ